MNQSHPHTTPRIAFVQATWHKDIVDQARLAFIDELAALGIARDSVDVFEVQEASKSPCRQNFWPSPAAIGRSSPPA